MAVENESSPFRRRHLPEVFTHRGTFSPISPSARRSEIPINTIDYQPRDALFSSGCGHRWFRRHSRCFSKFATAVICVTVVTLLIAAITVHFQRSHRKESVQDYQPHVVNNILPHLDSLDPINDNEDDNDVDGGESVETLSPLENGPPKERIFAEILDDSQEHYDILNAQKQLHNELAANKVRFRRSLLESSSPKINIQSQLHHLQNELSAAKARFRRNIPEYYYTAEENNYSVQSKLEKLLADIRMVRKKLQEYEKLAQFTMTPFYDYSLAYPMFYNGLSYDPIIQPPVEQSTLAEGSISTEAEDTSQETSTPSTLITESSTLQVKIQRTTERNDISESTTLNMEASSIPTITDIEIQTEPPKTESQTTERSGSTETPTLNMDISEDTSSIPINAETKIEIEPSTAESKTTEKSETTIFNMEISKELTYASTTTEATTVNSSPETSTLNEESFSSDDSSSPTTLTDNLEQTEHSIVEKELEGSSTSLLGTATTAESDAQSLEAASEETIENFKPPNSEDTILDQTEPSPTTFATTVSMVDITETTGIVDDFIPKLPKKTLTEMKSSLDAEIMEQSNDFVTSGHVNDKIHGMSLDEAKTLKLLNETRSKWESKLVSNADIKAPTAPDSTGTYEATKTGQQLSYAPTGYSHVIIPYQLCFYPNSKIQPRSASMQTFNIPSLTFPNMNSPISSTPNPALPQQNVYNVFMNNNNPPAQHYPSFPSFMSAPGFMSYPQQFPRQFNGAASLFCSTLQSPFLQYPSNPGTTDFSHSRCLNCDDDLMSIVRASNSSVNPERSDNDDDKLVCPEGMSRCHDDGSCILSPQWCDGRVHCADASDELHCSCKDRLSDGKVCDGYADCPNAEDEKGCSECPPTSFSCGGWDSSSSCIPLSKRCDGQADCANGKDEFECSALASNLETFSEVVSHEEGFLLRNWRGSWYPVCSVSGRQIWAEEACTMASSSGDDILVENRDLPRSVKGPYITQRLNGDFVLERHCKGHVSLYVQCPPQQCGTRIKAEDNTAFTQRFRRLIEQGEAPRSAEDRPFIAWWEQIKEDVEEKFGVENVVARLVPIQSEKRRKRGEEGRVVGGRSSEAGSWPWAVAVYRDGFFHCGGVLLDREWVLTAAHCIADFKNHFYQVRVGMLRRFSFSPAEEVRRIVHIVGHESYDKNTMKNDLAIMKMSAPVQYGKWVRPTCLPVQDDGSSASIGLGPTPGTQCIAIGWGAVKEHGFDPDRLREVELPILERCKHRADIEGNEICAGFVQGGKDTCQGDSGGPLMCQETTGNRAWYVAGVVSHGNGCARVNEAGAYTRVSLFVDWLMKHTSDPVSKEAPLAHCPGFQCTSHPGLCLPASHRCNNHVNCLGGEDEQDCEHTRGQRSGETSDTLLSSGRQLERSIYNYTVSKSLPDEFNCQELPQTVPASYRCDGYLDCQDASDEVNCTCKDFLDHKERHRICDGNTDCLDGSDESDCFECPENYFNCRKSHQCLVADRRCDKHVDCALGEDEDNCWALSQELPLLSNQNADFNEIGWAVENQKGEWRWCMNDQDKNKVASAICEELGFDVGKSVLVPELDETLGVNCSKIWVECDTQVAKWDVREANLESAVHPWNVSIRIDGNLVCTGVLVDKAWVVTSIHCLPQNQSAARSQITAEMGVYVHPPKITIIDAIQFIPKSEILLLHLQEPAKLCTSIKPIGIPFTEPQSPNLGHCVALGPHGSVSVQLKKGDCGESNWCATRLRRPLRGCRSPSWTGVAVCDSKDGWIPVGLFTEIGGACGFQSSNFNDITPFFKDIDFIIGDTVSEKRESLPCENGGYRCLGGKCIEKLEMCDGMPNCEFGDDEKESLCDTLDGCKRNEFSCSENGTCIFRGNFGDDSVKCESKTLDVADRPCLQYLWTVHPNLLCDNTRNCPDKSDEENSFCTKPRDFSCPNTNITIPTEFVCDDEKDCPEGEDELKCQGLKKISTTPKEFEYKKMSYGIWHSLCNGSPTLEEADKECLNLGYKKAADVVRKHKIPDEIVLDDFTSVQLNSNFTLQLRGPRPFATLKKSTKPCLITFVTCH